MTSKTKLVSVALASLVGIASSQHSLADNIVPRDAVAISLSAADGHNKVTVARSLSPTRTSPRIPFSTRPSDWNDCPVRGDLLNEDQEPTDYVTIFNPDESHSAVVSVWTLPKEGTPLYDPLTDAARWDHVNAIILYMAAYMHRETPPQTDDEKKACDLGLFQSCSPELAEGDPTACVRSMPSIPWPGIMYDANVPESWITILPQHSIVIYIAGGPGDYRLSVRTEALR